MASTNSPNEKLKSIKKTEFFKEYKRFKLQEDFLEKNIASVIIKGSKTGQDFIRQINDQKLKADAKRESKIQEITREVISVVKELNGLKSTIQKTDASTIRNLDVSDCGFRLTRLSNKIEDLNLKLFKSGPDELAREEESLSRDLQEFEKSIFSEIRAKPSISKSTADRKWPVRSESIDQFTELVSRTGHTQGWSDEDHSLFLKIRKKCDSVAQLVTELKKKRPHIANQDIVNHEAWQKVYTELQDKRKREIADWRSRNVKKSETGSSAEEKIENLQNKICKEVKKGEKEEEEETQKDKKKKKKKKKMIEEWRAEKSRKFAMDEEQKIRLENSKLAEEKRRRDSKRSDAMLRLRNFKKTKRSKSSDEDQRKSNSQINSSSLRLIKSFRELDEKFIKNRLIRLKLSENLNETKSRKSIITISKESSKPLESYSNFQKPTKVWKEKCKRDIKTEDNIPFGRINYVKDIQRLQHHSTNLHNRRMDDFSETRRK